MKLLFWVITAPLVIIAASFAVSNRQTVEVGIWPLPFIWDAPLYLIVLGSLGVGIVLGGAVTGLGALGVRLRARNASRRIASSERDLSARQQAEQKSSEQAGPSGPPKPSLTLPGALTGGS